MRVCVTRLRVASIAMYEFQDRHIDDRVVYFVVRFDGLTMSRGQWLIVVASDSI